MKKKPILERIGDFMEGKGFYIVLFLCVAAIGISGYYLFSSLDMRDGDAAVAAPTQVVVMPTVQPVKPTVAPTPAPTAKPTRAGGLGVYLAGQGTGGGRLLPGGAGL